MNTVYDILRESVVKHQDDPALVYGDHRISYRTLGEGTDRLAAGLKSLGIDRDQRVAVMLPNMPHFVMSTFALLKLGSTAVPLSIFASEEEIRSQSQDADIQAVVYWEGFRPQVARALAGMPSCRHRIVLGERRDGERRLTALMEGNDPLQEAAAVEPEETAFIMYTAGTTGNPKGVELTHRNVLSTVDACYTFFNLTPDDSVSGVFPLYHPLGHTLVLGTFLRAGGCVVLQPRFDAEAILRAIASEKVSYFVGVPSMYRALLHAENVEDVDMSSLKFCLSSGDAMKEETLKMCEERFKAPVLEGYGLTEACSIVTFNGPNRERRAGSIGLPLPGFDMKIVDEQGEEVRPGKVGEVLLKGPNVMKGYLNHPEETAETLKDGWLYTGDLALLDESGFGFIQVREENVILKSGFKVYPREIEDVLCQFGKVREAVVVGLPDAKQGEDIHACVVLGEGEEATPEEIITACKTEMAAYKCPSVVHFMPSLPKGPTGRLIRGQVKRLLMKENHRAS